MAETGVDTIFSSDESFFAKHSVSNHRRDESDTTDKDSEMPEYDPPSRVCGGVFSKFIKIASKNHHKSSSAHNNRHNHSTHHHNTYNKKQMKKKQQHPQHQHQSNKARHEQQHPHESKLISKLTNKIMKRKPDPSLITEDAEKAQAPDEDNFKPTVVKQGTQGSIMSSLSDSEVSSSPWVSEDDYNNDFPSASTSNMVSDRFFKNLNGGKGKSAISVSMAGVTMGESTGKYTNHTKPQTRTNASLQDLQILLKEMKDLNGMVKENSTVLQAGIKNIALEIKSIEGQPKTPTPTDDSRADDPFWLRDDQNGDCFHTPQGWREEMATPVLDSDCNTRGGENRNNSRDGIVADDNDSDNDNHDDSTVVQKLKLERTHYRSEAETLRLEMEGIKEQLSQLQQFLPQAASTHSRSFHPHQTASTHSRSFHQQQTASTHSRSFHQQQQQQQQSLDENDWQPQQHWQQHPVPEEHSMDYEKHPKLVHSVSTCSTSASTTMSTSMIGAEDGPTQNHHHHQSSRNPGNNSDSKLYLDTIDNPSPSSHSRRSVNVSFHSEIRDIVSEAVKYRQRSPSPIGRLHIKRPPSPKRERPPSPRRERLSQLKHQSQLQRQAQAPSLPAQVEAPPMEVVEDTKKKVGSRRFRGRSMSPMRRRSLRAGIGLEKKMKPELVVAKTFYQKQWERTETPITPASSSSGRATTATSTTSRFNRKTERDCELLTADKKYREMSRSRQHHQTAEDPNDEYLSELRKSWYDRRGLVMEATSSNSVGSRSSRRSAPEPSGAQKEMVSPGNSTSKYQGKGMGINCGGHFQ